MADITYENLIAARKASKEEPGDFDIMGMANLALKIMEQAQILKAGGAGNVMQSRAPEKVSAGSPSKSPINADSILETLQTVKSLKGDLKISELEKLIKEHKDQVSMLLGKMG